MSMMGRFAEVSAADLASLQASPDAVAALFVDPRFLGGMSAGVTKLAELDLDKAWHGVHYLLTGSADPVESPLGRIVLGGTELGEDDLGYGPARFLTPADTATSAGELIVLAAGDGWADRFDPDAMTALGLYPGVWGADDREWLADAVTRLAAFYATAAERGSAVLTCIV
jgi:hypothetical protein